MPLRNNTKANLTKNTIFFPLLFLTLLLWILYRTLFSFPIWFDEIIGKAIFFGLSVWAFITVTNNKSIVDTFAPQKLKRGLLLGITVGGVFGFVFSLLAVLQTGKTVEAVSLFNSNTFWYEFILAMFTAFWETMFFYSFTMTIIREKFSSWSSLTQILLVALIFLAFHLPNTFIRYDLVMVAPQTFILFLFAVGQGYLFYSTKNAFALILSHTIWGMVLLVHGGI